MATGNLREVVSPISGRKYVIRKTPPMYAGRFKHLRERKSGDEVSPEVWSDIVGFLKATVVDPVLSSEEDVLSLGEDADYVFMETVKHNQPSEAYLILFRGQGSASGGGSAGGTVREEAQ